MGRKAQKNDSLPGSLDMLILRTLSQLRQTHVGDRARDGSGVMDMLRRLRYWTESANRSEALREEMELHLWRLCGASKLCEPRFRRAIGKYR